jgi:ATP-dependent DNA helicase RecQ
VALTAAGRRALVEREPIAIREAALAPVKAQKSKAPAAVGPHGDPDAELFAALKIVRKRLADERNVPAFVVFSDAVLLSMAREVPATPVALRAISGVGDKKLADFGEIFLAAIREVRG